MRKFRPYALLFAAIFSVLSAMMFLVIKLDIYMNSWWLIEAASKWHWYNYLFSGHGITMIHFWHGYVWLVLPAVFALAGTFVMYFQDKTEMRKKK